MDDMFTSLSHYGYIILFLYSLGGGFVALIAASVLSSMGKMDLGIVIAVAFLANFVGDNLLFYMARYHKDQMHEYLKNHRRKLAFAHLLLKRRGSWIIVTKKFIYGVKTIVTLAIGLSKYPFGRFNLYNLLGSLVWAVSIGGVSYLFSEVLITLYTWLGGHIYAAPIFLAIVGGSLWGYMHYHTRKR